MGYHSVAKGEISFSPELPLYAIKGNKVIYKYINADYDIMLNPEFSIISAPEDSFKAYWIEDNLKELVSEILKINPDTVFEGHIQIMGEGDGAENIDMWRLRIRNGKVQQISPTLVWPED